MPALPRHAAALARPARNHYLPDLHHLRLELEEAVTPEGHPVRFGFNPLEFENFSWRGYAQMAPIQVGWGGRPPGCGGRAQGDGRAAGLGSPRVRPGTAGEGRLRFSLPTPSPGLWPG